MEDIFARLYEMTAFSNIIAEPQFLIMYAIAFILLYLGIKKKYEPLLLIPIAFGVLLANFPGGEMGVVQADENGMVMVNGVMKNIWEMPLHEIAHDLGLMNFIYYMLQKDFKQTVVCSSIFMLFLTVFCNSVFTYNLK